VLDYVQSELMLKRAKEQGNLPLRPTTRCLHLLSDPSCCLCVIYAAGWAPEHISARMVQQRAPSPPKGIGQFVCVWLTLSRRAHARACNKCIWLRSNMCHTCVMRSAQLICPMIR
jgi:hypothetical protein